MKFNEMNKREQKAYINIYHACNWLIGGLENATMDYPHDSEEYKNAVECLDDEEWLVNELYTMATTELYKDGSCCFNSKIVQQELRDINFCGKEWLMERCRKRIAKALKDVCIG